MRLRRRVRWARVGGVAALGAAAALGVLLGQERAERRALEERLRATESRLLTTDLNHPSLGELRALASWGELEELRAELERTRERLREKERLIAAVEAAVEWDVAEHMPPPPPVPSLDTEVTAVVGGLVMLDAGRDQGVQRGWHFSVYRQNQFVGKVVVARVEPDHSACELLFTAEDAELRPGDRAATRLW